MNDMKWQHTIYGWLVGGMILLVGLVSCRSSHEPVGDSMPMLDSLDRLIANQSYYAQLKEDRLRDLSKALAASSDDRERFRATLQVAQEYRPYRFDSAYLYAKEAVELGKAIGPREQRAAEISLAYCFLSSGLFLETSDVIRELDRHNLTREEEVELYLLQMKNSFDLSLYNSHTVELAETYRREGLAYADSALRLLDDDSSLKLYVLSHYYLEGGRQDQALKTLSAYLEKNDLSNSDRAIAYSLLGQTYMRQAEVSQAVRSFATSACYDILSGTRETTSMGQLASLLYQAGEVERAMKYIDVALEDANFYDAKHRKMSVGDIRPVIEQRRLREIELRRQQMMTYTVAVSILCLMLIGAFVVIVAQMRRLRLATRTIVEKNNALSLTNERMEEANAIKDEYIGLSFSRQAGYIREQEELFHFVLKKIEAGQYDAIRHRLKRSYVIQGRKEMYVDFDETFTRLFPTYIAEYNMLFPPEEREDIQPGGAMTPEMRIFALIRVGITKPEQIARFLNYSVNTINTYKTRAKNKSLVDNKDFESEIMKIGRTK